MNPTLTTAQLQLLKAAIAADPVLNAKPNNSDGNFDIAAAFNQIATAPNTVWKTSVAVTEVMQNGFDWTRVDNLTVGKARIWEWMTAAVIIKPNQPNVRAGVLAVFSVAADAPNRQAVFNHSSRVATRAEKLLFDATTGGGSTGSGNAFAPPTDQGVGPSTMAAEGDLTYQEVASARALA